MVKVKMPSLAV